MSIYGWHKRTKAGFPEEIGERDEIDVIRLDGKHSRGMAIEFEWTTLDEPHSVKQWRLGPIIPVPPKAKLPETDSLSKLCDELKDVEFKPIPEREALKKVLESQVSGNHYRKHGAYQPWEVLRRWMTPEEMRGFMKGQAIVYLARERDKNGLEDLEKAKHYIEALIEFEKAGAT